MHEAVINMRTFLHVAYVAIPLCILQRYAISCKYERDTHDPEGPTGRHHSVPDELYYGAWGRSAVGLVRVSG